MKKNHFKICYFNIFCISLHCKKMIGMENKGLKLQEEFYKQDSLLFEELIEANKKKGGNNG